MTSVFKLKNPVKHYDWGSPEWIPQLLGCPNEGGEPWAELWMGVHPEGPSELAQGGLLPELIRQDPVRYLGEAAAREYGGLPFLYKLLAAARPLSIQAHPNLEQAKKGWERGDRNYKDPNHKPEIICALTPFTALAGFREPGEISKRLAAFGFAPLAPLLAALETPDEDTLRRFLDALFSLPPETRQALSEYARSRALKESGSEYAEEWKYTACFAELYPGDPAIIAPLYLNLLTLKPGEAMNIPAGILHAYVYGFGVELMANSDNVLRGGLTPKHIDMKELTAILRFTPFKPEILRPSCGKTPGLFRYPSPCPEFSLTSITGRGGGTPGNGPAIVLVTEGELCISSSDAPQILKRGESAFIAAGEPMVFSGDYTLYVAGTGSFCV
ncbi:mannose-6-phosphate isomerase, class I [Spirochaetia bacterium]|nr:mannose-6-phosphate isomerase, class I [Spirochaetia bacterium]